MTPYSLEQTRRKLEERMEEATKNGQVTPTLIMIVDVLSVILQHLADVEVDAIMRNADR